MQINKAPRTFWLDTVFYYTYLLFHSKGTPPGPSRKKYDEEGGRFRTSITESTHLERSTVPGELQAQG